VNQGKAERVATSIGGGLPALATMLEPRAVKLHRGDDGWVTLVDVAEVRHTLVIDDVQWSEDGPISYTVGKLYTDLPGVWQCNNIEGVIRTIEDQVNRAATEANQ
jgi:hypothetical protein